MEEVFDNSKSFYGQQEDEVVLCEIRPHRMRKLLGALRALLLLLILGGVVLLIHDKTTLDSQYFLIAGLITSFIVFMLVIGWVWYSTNRARLYITDRRVVRIELGFPIFVNRRSLFWDEVLKIKSLSPNILFRFLKIGSLVVTPQMTAGGDVHFQFVYFFEDLTNYIDKILYLYKTKPEDVKAVRPFVAKASGERY